MNKIISFSVWGENPKYTVGAIKNAQLASTIYGDWKCRFYISDTVDKKIIDSLYSLSNTELILKNEKDSWGNMFWKFETCYDETVDISIFRDTDSRLSLREKLAVDEWLQSDKTFHIMRDHPFHRFPILGGMWGYKKNIKYNMKELFNKAKISDNYGTDYQFFIEVLYPEIQDDKIVHDEFFDKKPFPSSRIDNEFIGDVFDENDNRHPEFYKHIK